MNRTEEREALYTAYSEKVRGYVFGKVANRHDAEDLVSDVFLKAYEKYPTFDADRASVSTWLYTITRNTVIDYFRTHRPGVELPEDLPDGPDTLFVQMISDYDAETQRQMAAGQLSRDDLSTRLPA